AVTASARRCSSGVPVSAERPSSATKDCCRSRRRSSSSASRGGVRRAPPPSASTSSSSPIVPPGATCYLSHRMPCRRAFQGITRFGKLRPVSPRIDIVTLGVSDLERSLAFYRALGFESPGVIGAQHVGDATTPGGAAVMFELGNGLTLALYGRDD